MKVYGIMYRYKVLYYCIEPLLRNIRRVNKMKNRIISLITAIIMVFSSQIVLAESDVPSGYAQEEVDLAMFQGIVPEALQERYQEGITRYEYVLIALEVLALNEEDVVIAKRYPFTDIAGHPYESAIIKAYNAGLINGYEDGSFKPDRLINRQEIATLVVNLVKSIDDTRVISQLEEYIYSDQESIGSWAQKNIDYCYANNIMKGTGTGGDGRSIIAPLANATIEQAILLMYRLADAEDLYTSGSYSNVVITDMNDGVETTTISNGFTAFANANGDEIATYLYKVQLKAAYHLDELTKDSISLVHEDGSYLVYSKHDYELKNYLYLTDLSNTDIVDVYKGLVDLTTTNGTIDSVMDSAIGQFQSSSTVDIIENIETDYHLEIYAEEIEIDDSGLSQMYYRVKLKKDL